MEAEKEIINHFRRRCVGLPQDMNKSLVFRLGSFQIPGTRTQFTCLIVDRSRVRGRVLVCCSNVP